MGCAEGRSPFAGSMRVSLRYDSSPFLARKGVRGMIEMVFQHPARFAPRWFGHRSARSDCCEREMIVMGDLLMFVAGLLAWSCLSG